MRRLRSCLARLLLVPLTAGVLALAAGSLPLAFGVTMAHAGTTTGSAVSISGVDNLANTVDAYAKGNLGKVVGIALGLAAAGLTVAGRTGAAALAATGALGGAFVPSMVGTAYDATAAAPLIAGAGPASAVASWWTPALGLLYPALLALKWVRDPVFLAALLVMVLGTRALRHAPAVVPLA
jgi:hypothetical protein